MNPNHRSGENVANNRDVCVLQLTKSRTNIHQKEVSPAMQCLIEALTCQDEVHAIRK